MPALDPDWRLRLAAFAQLRALRDKNGSDLVTHDELASGFEFEGERIRLAPTQQGIWKPRQLGTYGAALTILTVAPRPGRPAPYDDQLDEETGYFIYRYERTDPDNSRNRSVRRAMELGRPLIYDLDILGIDPDRVVHVSERILEEHDGPMLQHGLKAMHGVRIIVPNSPSQQPNPDFLAERFERWRAA